MIGILADANIQGYVEYLVAVMRAEPWKIFWEGLGVSYLRFAEVGLADDASDSLIWETCQQRHLILITDNRTEDDDDDSLEATIRAKSTSASLPVITISRPNKLRTSREYRDRVIVKILESIDGIDNLRGTGRLYAP